MHTRTLIAATVVTSAVALSGVARADETAPSTGSAASAASAASPPASVAGTPESPTVAPASSPAASPGRPAFEDRVVSSSSPARSFPAIGGHLGMALPIATFGSNTSVIGSDFVTVGLTPGLTVHLDERWAIDFEFIAFNELKNTPATTTFIVDPGIIRKFDGFVAGLRVATQVGAPTNSGLVPIVVVPFKIGQRAVWFLEFDVPMFVRDNGRKPEFSVTGLFQTGVGF